MGYTHNKYVDALTQGSKFYREIGDVPHLYIVHRRPLHEDEQSITIIYGADCHQEGWKKTRKMDGKQDL
jgi:hypothetical protein